MCGVVDMMQNCEVTLTGIVIYGAVMCVTMHGIVMPMRWCAVMCACTMLR